MNALLIIDVQNDFLLGGALPVPKGNEVIPVINAIQRDFSRVLATKDWHPLHHVSFASTHGKKAGESVVVKGVEQHLWPDHCIEGSLGAQFPSGLETGKIERVFFKGSDLYTDSYSAFYDNARIRSTGLGPFLKEQGIDKITVVGLATDYCVKYSVLDACLLGFDVTVLLEGCRGIDFVPGDTNRAIEEMKEAGAHVRHYR